MTIRDHLTRCADLERRCAEAPDAGFHQAEVALLDAADQLRADLAALAGIDMGDLAKLIRFL